MGRHSVSADGRFVLFTAQGAGISEDDKPGDEDAELYRRDALTGETVLISREDGGAGASITPIPDSSLSADGNRAVFYDQPSKRLLVRDVAAQTTTVVNQLPDGTLDPFAGFGSWDISDDGTRVAYASASDLTGTGEATGLDVFVRTLADGTVTLASRGDGDGPDGDADSTQPVLDRSGERVAFSSKATNLGDGDADAQTDLHVRDLAAGRTILVNRSSAGQKGDAPGSSPSISADATRVVFVSSATNLDPAASGANSAVFVRDLAAQTTTLVSRDGPVGPQLEGFSGNASISADGTASPGGRPLTRRRAAPSRRHRPSSGRSTGPSTSRPTDGAAGLLVDSTVIGVAMDADGSCVAFDTDAQNVIAAPLPGDARTAWLRVRGTSCPDPPPGPDRDRRRSARPARSGRHDGAGHQRLAPHPLALRGRPQAHRGVRRQARDLHPLPPLRGRHREAADPAPHPRPPRRESLPSPRPPCASASPARATSAARP